MDNNDFSGYSYETAVVELEEIIKKLETGNSSLEEAMTLYQKGVLLSNFCNSQLENAEKKIMILADSVGGAKIETEFNISASES
jgi:exodeoxyribonuclease VII small subunit